jgi:HD-like signal output (HDOD) protein
MAELQSEEASIQQVAELIAGDLGMAAKILQMVNSAFFGLYRRVNDIKDAVMLLGLDAIKALVLSINVFSAFDPRQMPFLDVGALWEHSLATGGYARQIMTYRKLGREETTAAFLAGILHDIGKLILAVNFSDAYRKLSQADPIATDQRLARERETIGTTHAEIGAYLMGLWGLEPPILTAIAFHHRPADSQTASFGPLTAVHVANGVDHRLRTSPVNGDDFYDTAYLASLQIADQVAEWQQACAATEDAVP